MVKITNGKAIVEVSQGAFDGIYRHQGYTLYAGDGQVRSEPVQPAESEKSEEDKFVEELSEKPISQWNKDEVKQFAAIKGIDISGTKNANEAKERIKQFMDAANEE